MTARTLTLGGLFTLVSACGGAATMDEPQPEPVLDPVVETSRPSTAPSCEPSDATLTASDALPSGASEYHLVMIRGDAQGRPAWVDGSLTLEPRPRELLQVRDWATPLQGTADLDVARVGAHDTGALDSEDPQAPGVLVLRSSGSDPMILLRLGAAANRSDQTPFDGAFTVLTVHAIDGDGFVGSWRSGSFGNEVQGYFCASVVSP